MKLERLALLAEVVGGAAIVISLIVLVLEVRQNTAAVRASTYEEEQGVYLFSLRLIPGIRRHGQVIWNWKA